MPLGLIYWPLLVGVHLCFLDQERTGRVRIGSLFGGFRDFMQSLTISLLALAAALALAAVFLVFFFLAAFIAKGLDWTEDAQAAYALSCGGIVLFFGVGAFHAVLGFAPHLLAERGLSGIDAVKVSARAARLNFPGLFVLWWMHFLLSTAASLCCVPFLFVFPVCLAAVVEAFRRVFGEAPAG